MCATARKILCTYRVMYSLHVRRMYRANLGVCSRIGAETRPERRRRTEEPISTSIFAKHYATTTRHTYLGKLVSRNTFPPRVIESPPASASINAKKSWRSINLRDATAPSSNSNYIRERGRSAVRVQVLVANRWQCSPHEGN